MLLLVTKSHPDLLRHAHPNLGRLIQPRHYSSIEATAAAGIPWAADNDCFQGLDPDAFDAMLDRIKTLPGCLFVTCPDVVGDHLDTLKQFGRWAPAIARRGLPIAFVLQDGADEETIPWESIDALFIGGTTEFKLSENVEDIILFAKRIRRGFRPPIWVHMGRVNSLKRIRYAQEIGCDSVDGTCWARFNDTYLDWGLAEVQHASTRQPQTRIGR